MTRRLITDKNFKILIFLGLLALVVIIFSQKIEFTAVDLGRHLQNGQVVWHNPQVLFTNFYSYTQANFVFINHHWFSGVILYGVYWLGGFPFLSAFNVILALLTFVSGFILAKRKAGFYLPALVSLPVIFLLSERVEVRPEAFSYLFIILVWAVVDRVATNRKYLLLWWLIPLFILWVNLHIYFFVGLVLLAFQVVAEFLPPFFQPGSTFSERFLIAGSAAKPWLRIFLATTLACLLNPNTWRGLLYPFNIFNNYGYEIAENKSIFYLGHLMINYNFTIFKFLLGALILSWLTNWFITKKIRLFTSFISLFFAVLALLADRNLALFSLAALILISQNLAWLRSYQLGQYRLYLASGLIFIIFFSGWYLLVDSSGQHNFIKNSPGWGLAEGSTDAFHFFQANKLSGPIFNNYDVGSALIFWLYPAEKVFVDNRPEAYSNNFFSDLYKPMQTNPAVWQTASAKYKFKTIWFSYGDSTPWAQQFLHTILSDKNWALVYFDRYSVILLNKKLNDATALDKLTLNDQAFRSRWRSLVESSPDLKNEFSLASLASNDNQNDLAAEIYKEIIFRYPNNQAAYAALGYLYASSLSPADLNLSLFYLERALRFGGQLPNIYDQIGLVNWQLAKYKTAEDSWHSALKLDSQDVSALYYLRQATNLRQSGKLPVGE